MRTFQAIFWTLLAIIIASGWCSLFIYIGMPARICVLLWLTGFFVTILTGGMCCVSGSNSDMERRR